MYWPANQVQTTFLEFVGHVEEYAYPLREMWPSFWLKAAAVRHDDAWCLCYFSLCGRWSGHSAAHEFRELSDALVAVSIPLDAETTWNMVESLVDTGSIALLPEFIALVPQMQRPISPTVLWQEPVQWELPETIKDVCEPADWRYLHTSGTLQWLDDLQTQFALQRALQPYLSRVSERDNQSFIASRFGSGKRQANNYSLEIFQYFFDLPLALRVVSGIPDHSTRTRPLYLASRPPFALGEFTVTSGTRPPPDAPVHLIETGPTHEDGWMSGTVIISATVSKVWLANPHLYRPLVYDQPLPTPQDQAAQAIGYVYAPTKPGNGLANWRKQLVEGKNAEFEVALANALSRLGIPVLFSGQLRQEDKVSGPATPGFDLVALDHVQRRAVVISAKGITHNPGDDDVENLLKGVATIAQLLQGWRVTGLIACHASAERLSRMRERKDLRFWGQDELELLLQADTKQAIDYLLWAPPGEQWYSPIIPHV